jgi:hypothetical protein
MYSFGRLNPYNPFIGGFVHESIDHGTFKRFYRTKTKIYSMEVNEEQFKKIAETIDDFKTRVGYQDNMDKNEFETWLKTHEKDYQKILDWEKEIQEAHNKWIQENAPQIKANETNYSNYIQDLQD